MSGKAPDPQVGPSQRGGWDGSRLSARIPGGRPPPLHPAFVQRLYGSALPHSTKGPDRLLSQNLRVTPLRSATWITLVASQASRQPGESAVPRPQESLSKSQREVDSTVGPGRS